MEKEIRTFPLAELRVEGDKKPQIVGYASVFDQKSEDLGGFREIVKQGAFKKTIAESDIRALFNHDPNYVLGRKKTGTLQLSEDDHGLRISINPPETTWAKDLLTSIRRGDIDQMSFGFKTIKDDWEKRDGENIRSLSEVRLFDISPVTFPAYPQTSVEARSKLESIAKETPSEPADKGHSEEKPVPKDHSHRAELAEIDKTDLYTKTMEV
jgi:HK97 family phage prohead protease